jgi:hypothetical protein
MGQLEDVKAQSALLQAQINANAESLERITTSQEEANSTFQSSMATESALWMAQLANVETRLAQLKSEAVTTLDSMHNVAKNQAEADGRFHAALISLQDNCADTRSSIQARCLELERQANANLEAILKIENQLQLKSAHLAAGLENCELRLCEIPRQIQDSKEQLTLLVREKLESGSYADAAALERMKTLLLSHVDLASAKFSDMLKESTDNLSKDLRAEIQQDVSKQFLKLRQTQKNHVHQLLEDKENNFESQWNTLKGLVKKNESNITGLWDALSHTVCNVTEIHAALDLRGRNASSTLPSSRR